MGNKNRNRTTVPPQQGTNVNNYEQPPVETHTSATANEGVPAPATEAVIVDPKELAESTVPPTVKELYNESAAEIAAAEAETKPVVEIPVGYAQPTPVLVDPYQLPLSASASSRLTVQELKDYIAAMSTKIRMPAEQGGQVQSHLYHTLIQAINTRAEDFDATFGLVMRLIRENLSGVFSMENVHRYTPHATLPAKSMAHFRYLLSVLTGAADPSLRNESLRQTNLDKAFRSFNIKEDARQRVLNFFNV